MSSAPPTSPGGLASRAARPLTRHGFTVTRTGNAGNQNHTAFFVTPAGRKPSRPAALCRSRRTPTHAEPTATTM
ncbi:LytR C-terminal domain-containing protein [Streptomyces mirabilis]|uniref:LytR C-terminal domain-containing protein n=1 Tax=Streptomyces mirabilis TaxID=68239 RepID=UPI00363D95C4